jgi:Transaldolase/Fructose-6-phosphate aldolase
MERRQIWKAIGQRSARPFRRSQIVAPKISLLLTQKSVTLVTHRSDATHVRTSRFRSAPRCTTCAQGHEHGFSGGPRINQTGTTRGAKNVLDNPRYEILAVRDIQDAADWLPPVYLSSKRRDGYISLEVSPYLARDTQDTVDEARRLRKAVRRENVMIKVPGTAEGIPAFQQLTSEGININVTLLFSQEVYERVAEAHIAGLEHLAARGGDVSKIASVAIIASSSAALIVRSIPLPRRGSRSPKTRASRSN